MRKRSITFIATLLILLGFLLVFAVQITRGQQNTSRELQMKNSEISSHDEEKRLHRESPGRHVDPSYQRYLDSKSERLDKERNQIIQRGFQEQNRRGK